VTEGEDAAALLFVSAIENGGIKIFDRFALDNKAAFHDSLVICADPDVGDGEGLDGGRNQLD
jgi:hypothetical protein